MTGGGVQLATRGAAVTAPDRGSRLPMNGEGVVAEPLAFAGEPGVGRAHVDTDANHVYIDNLYLLSTFSDTPLNRRTTLPSPRLTQSVRTGD